MNISLLDYRLKQQGITGTIAGVGYEDAQRPTAGPASWHAHNGGFVRVDWEDAPDSADVILIDSFIATYEDTGDFPWEENKADVISRFQAHPLSGKTPNEIYTLMQTAIDGWGSLAEAKADLREWLPLMAALLAWNIGLQDSE